MHARKNRNGLTAIEILISIFILFVLVGLMRNGVQVLNSVFLTGGRLEGQRQAQEVLFQISQDIRGARSVIDLSSSTLSLRVFDHRQGYDVDLSSMIFNPVTFGTVTYQYVMAERPYLSRTENFPGRSNTAKLLENILQPDDPLTADTEVIFTPYPDTGSIPYLGAHVVFRCALGPFRKQIKIFEIRAQVRSKAT